MRRSKMLEIELVKQKIQVLEDFFKEMVTKRKQETLIFKRNKKTVEEEDQGKEIILLLKKYKA